MIKRVIFDAPYRIRQRYRFQTLAVVKRAVTDGFHPFFKFDVFQRKAIVKGVFRNRPERRGEIDFPKIVAIVKRVGVDFDNILSQNDFAHFFRG